MFPVLFCLTYFGSFWIPFHMFCLNFRFRVLKSLTTIGTVILYSSSQLSTCTRVRIWPTYCNVAVTKKSIFDVKPWLYNSVYHMPVLIFFKTNTSSMSFNFSLYYHQYVWRISHVFFLQNLWTFSSLIILIFYVYFKQ